MGRCTVVPGVVSSLSSVSRPSSSHSEKQTLSNVQNVFVSPIVSRLKTDERTREKTRERPRPARPTETTRHARHDPRGRREGPMKRARPPGSSPRGKLAHRTRRPCSCGAPPLLTLSWRAHSEPSQHLWPRQRVKQVRARVAAGHRLCGVRVANVRRVRRGRAPAPREHRLRHMLRDVRGRPRHTIHQTTHYSMHQNVGWVCRMWRAWTINMSLTALP